MRAVLISGVVLMAGVAGGVAVSSKLMGQKVGPQAPDVATIQAAYEQEQGRGDKRHDPGLQVIKAQCLADADHRYNCWVQFVSRKDPNERIYSDVVTLSGDAGGWLLKSGLCRTS